MPVVLQISFRPRPLPPEADPAALHAQVEQRAHQIAHDVPGLLWKIWISQPDDDQGGIILGGTYLFVSREAAQAYLASPIPDDIRHEPEFTTTIWNVDETMSAVTHAPLTRPTTNNSASSS